MKSNNEQIAVCIWFDSQAEEAAKFYTSVFPNSSIGDITRYGKAGYETHHQPEGTVMTVEFNISGQEFMGLNGGPIFKPNPSISFFVVCETEDEINKSWDTLSKGGSVLMALDKYPWSEKYGWLQDKYGVTWQLALGKVSEVGQKLSPSLLYVNKDKDPKGHAEAAMNFYTSVFENSGIRGIARYEKGEGDIEGTVKHAQFNLNGQQFMAMDSSIEHKYTFTEALSLLVNCNNQEEIDYYWEKFTKDGEEGPCGWCKDKFGVSWQINAIELNEMLKDKDEEKVARVTEAFLKMKKFDIAKLRKAFNGERVAVS